MDVLLVPVGDHQYQLYCEVVDAGDSATGHETRRERLRNWFNRLVATAEEERRRADRPPGASDDPATGDVPFGPRVRSRILRWIAEAVAEQRLLWHLRKETEAALVHPDDVPFEEAMRRARILLRRDAERHRTWLLVDAALFVLSGLFVVVPGPNLIAYYFLFRVIGHLESWRGARRGVRTIDWHGRASGPLAELRDVVRLAPPARWERVSDVAGQLRLQHLAAFAAFFERRLASLS